MNSRKSMKTSLMILMSALLLMTPVSVWGRGESTEDPLGKYDETVKVLIGRAMLEANWPDGQSYADNVLLDYIKDKLNVEIEFAYDATNPMDAETLITLDLTSSTLPDIVMVEGHIWPQLASSGELADLTDALNTYGEGYTKDWLQSFADVYDFDWVSLTTVDGEILGIPKPFDSEIRGVWVRQDWIDKLELSIDEDGDRILSLDEIEMLAQAFKDNDPDATGNNVGIASMTELSWTTVTPSAIDSCFGVDHYYFFTDEEGKLYSGTVNDVDGAKEALTWWQDMYQKKLLDPEFITDNWDKECLEKWVNGQCGIIIGTPDAPIWMFPTVYESNPDARFSYYGIKNAHDENVISYVEAYYQRAVLVRNDYEHPEVVVKLLNLIIDLVQDENLVQENPELYELVSDGTFQYMDPLLMNVKLQGQNEKKYNDIIRYVNGEVSLDEVSLSNQKDAESCKQYLEDPSVLTGIERAQAETILQGYSLSEVIGANGEYEYKRKADLAASEAYTEKFADLYALEKEYWTKIMIGELPVDAWDDFVELWYDQGGREILEQGQALLDAQYTLTTRIASHLQGADALSY